MVYQQSILRFAPEAPGALPDLPRGVRVRVDSQNDAAERLEDSQVVGIRLRGELDVGATQAEQQSPLRRS